MEEFTLTIAIAAPPARVWQVLFDPVTYSQWTAAFSAGSRYEGQFAEGATVRFLSDSEGSHLDSRVVAFRPPEFLSLLHDFPEPAYENYTLSPTSTGTLLRIDQDLDSAWAAYMRETWPHALARLKELCEA
jgi:uncharacterized protein YndB with AHSA1/START domain